MFMTSIPRFLGLNVGEAHMSMNPLVSLLLDMPGISMRATPRDGQKHYPVTARLKLVAWISQ